MIRKLELYARHGVELFLCGRLSTPEEIADEICMHEDLPYMADFVRDDDEKLCQIRYDRLQGL
ncbi:MAG: hypothetical protein K5985_00295 [Lachnospiraceae bacterium]|nr:hypothetical protein [Lachnospiraceae bacterium]